MLEELTDRQIESRLRTIETMIAQSRSIEELKTLNAVFQRLIDEQVRRDMSSEDKHAAS